MLLTLLAKSLAAGELEAGAAGVRLREMLGRKPRWAAGLAARFVAAFSGKTRPRVRDLLAFLRADAALQEALRKEPLRPERWLLTPPAMQPAGAALGWPVPPICTAGELAGWLCLDVRELDWLADLRGTGKHYHYTAVEKRDGSTRLLEAPKTRLKAAQRRILREILDPIPGHPAAHGFRAGRSIGTFAAPHTGQPVVLRMDLRDFFPSISRARVQALFRTLGYPEAVADLLGGLCTNVAPLGGPLYRQPHLPQGAPTSPALANLCFFGADCRLAGLAAAAGLHYTRYADDLAFSGAAAAAALEPRIGAIATEEGFTVQFRKTRLMRQGVRQHLAGLTVNAVCNVERGEFDRLKATLHNCARLGATEQNRTGHPAFREHLTGRVAFVESINPGRGRKLRALLERIEWET